MKHIVLHYLTLLFCIYYCVAATYRNEEHENIIGGHIAKTGEYPYQWHCGIDITHPNIFVGVQLLTRNMSSAQPTAANCDISDISSFYIGAGVTNMSDTKHIVTKDIERFKIHEQYGTKGLQNDICLIKTCQYNVKDMLNPGKAKGTIPAYTWRAYRKALGQSRIKGSFSFNNLVKPVELNEEHVKEHTNCSISGWGQWRPFEIVTAHPLKGATVPISNQDQCVSAYKKEPLAPQIDLDSMICAGDMKGGTGTCGGDSGGPLVCNNKLTGIISFGFGCAKPGFPDVYTKVEHYIKWINQNKL